MSMTAAETARRALDILDADGWNKGSITQRVPRGLSRQYPNGSHCVGGAWNLAHHATDDWQRNDATGGDDRYYLKPLVDLICAEYPEYCRHDIVSIQGNEWGYAADWADAVIIASWNNWPSITEEDVRRLLEKIASG